MQTELNQLKQNQLFELHPIFNDGDFFVGRLLDLKKDALIYRSVGDLGRLDSYVLNNLNFRKDVYEIDTIYLKQIETYRSYGNEFNLKDTPDFPEIKEWTDEDFLMTAKTWAKEFQQKKIVASFGFLSPEYESLIVQGFITNVEGSQITINSADKEEALDKELSTIETVDLKDVTFVAFNDWDLIFQTDIRKKQLT